MSRESEKVEVTKERKPTDVSKRRVPVWRSCCGGVRMTRAEPAQKFRAAAALGGVIRGALHTSRDWDEPNSGV